MTPRLARVAAVAACALLGQRAHAQQDFYFGVHAGGTQTRRLETSGYTGFESGTALGITGTMPVKSWLAVSLELIVVDKGLTHGTPHRFFEVPYLVRLTSPRGFGRVRPYLVAGAAYAYEMACVDQCSDPDRVNTDFSVVSGAGAAFTLDRWELALEHRRTRGQYTMNHRPANHATNDVRSLLLRLSLRIPGVVPDWM